MDAQKIKKDFPIFQRKINGKPIIYFDNTATTQKPRMVIDALKDFYENHNANIHRGVHTLSQEASKMYEDAHDKVSKFINANGKEEIIFTKNATESLNLVAHTINFEKGDEVIVSEMEHHSNIVPWMMLEKIKGIKLKFAPVNDEGEIDLETLDKMITEKTKLVSIVHISNFLGTVNPVREIGEMAKDKGAYFMIDGAQSAPHLKINVKKLNCDFFAFSAHKMCGPTGIGVLYGKKEVLETLPPFLGGGDMISKVTYENFLESKLPWKYEAGTANIADGYAFGVTIDYLEKIGMENIWLHDQELTKYALKRFEEIHEIEIYGPTDYKKRGGLIAFNIKELNPHDVAELLNEKDNIMVRSGNHCVQPLHIKYGITGSVRASFYIYNSKDEIDKLMDNLKEIVRGMRK